MHKPSSGQLGGVRNTNLLPLSTMPYTVLGRNGCPLLGMCIPQFGDERIHKPKRSESIFTIKHKRMKMWIKMRMRIRMSMRGG